MNTMKLGDDDGLVPRRQNGTSLTFGASDREEAEMVMAARSQGPLGFVHQPDVDGVPGRQLIRGVPSARGSLPQPPSQTPMRFASSELASVTEAVERLRVTIEDCPAPHRDPKDLREIKDSLTYLEAFLSINLVAHLDKALDERLTVVQRIDLRRLKARRWMTASIIVNLILAGVLVFEVRTGLVQPIVTELMETIRSMVL